MGFADLGGGGEITGLEEEQRGDRPRIEADAVAMGVGARPLDVGCENARFELVSGGVLRARPGGDFGLAAGEVGVGQLAWSLTEEDDKCFHADLGLGGDWRKGGLGVSGEQGSAKRDEREKCEMKTRFFHAYTLGVAGTDDL